MAAAHFPTLPLPLPLPLQAYADYSDMMELTESIIRTCAQVGGGQAGGGTGRTGRGRSVAGGWRSAVRCCSCRAQPLRYVMPCCCTTHSCNPSLTSPARLPSVAPFCRRLWDSCSCPTRGRCSTLSPPSAAPPCTTWSRMPAASTLSSTAAGTSRCGGGRRGVWLGPGVAGVGWDGCPG